MTCFDVPKYYFPTAGHPWSTDPAHQDVKDRLLLTEHVRFYGDDVAAVVAENEVAAAQALRLIKVEYDPFRLCWMYKRQWKRTLRSFMKTIREM